MIYEVNNKITRTLLIHKFAPLCGSTRRSEAFMAAAVSRSTIGELATDGLTRFMSTIFLNLPTMQGTLLPVLGPQD